MKFLVKSVNIHGRLKNAAKQFGFEVKNDLISDSNLERDKPMFSIFDDALMTVSHYNTVSEEKTASYKYFEVRDANGVYSVVAMIAGLISFDIGLVNDTATITSSAVGVELRPSLLSKFTVDNKMGRSLRFSSYKLNSFKASTGVKSQEIKGANFAEMHLHFPSNPNASDKRTLVHDLMTGSIYTVKNVQEMLGCSIDDFIAGLKTFDALPQLKRLASKEATIEDLGRDKNIFGFIAGGSIDGVDSARSLKYIILKGTKESIAIKQGVFLNAIDLSSGVYLNMLKQLAGPRIAVFRTDPREPVISFRETSDGSIRIVEADPVKALELREHTFDLIKKEYAT